MSHPSGGMTGLWNLEWVPVSTAGFLLPQKQENRQKFVSYSTFFLELSPQIGEAILLLGTIHPVIFILQECSIFALNRF